MVRIRDMIRALQVYDIIATENRAEGIEGACCDVFIILTDGYFVSWGNFLYTVVIELLPEHLNCELKCNCVA